MPPPSPEMICSWLQAVPSLVTVRSDPWTMTVVLRATSMWTHIPAPAPPEPASSSEDVALPLALPVADTDVRKSRSS